MPADSGAKPSRRSVLGGLLIAAVAAPLAACTSDDSGGSEPDANTLDVLDFGAKGDGKTDDSAAIARAQRKARRGDTVRFAQGRVFCHADVLKIARAGIRLTGSGTLRATNEQRSAVQLEADDIVLDGLTLDIVDTTQRWSAAEQHKLYLGPHAGIQLRDVTILGSAAAGVYSYGATDFRFTRVRVSDTRADGIHLTNGTRRGTVERPQCRRTGDDGVAVVSYLQDPTPCGNITIEQPVVRTTTGGRGVSVVGGHDVTYRDITVSDSSAASVYLACEGGDFVTHPTERVTVTGGRITGANTDAAIDHGAVLVYSGRSGGSVDAITISGLTVSDTRAGASRQVGVIADNSAATVSGIRFEDLKLAAEPTPYQGNAPTSPIRLEDVTAAGVRVRLGT